MTLHAQAPTPERLEYLRRMKPIWAMQKAVKITAAKRCFDCGSILPPGAFARPISDGQFTGMACH
ncbi:MAG: hypothetical protein ACR2PS_05655 [Pseudomonadales bacterium]